MRFLVLVKATDQSEAGGLPTREQLATMGRFNEEMINAGVMLAADGLHPTSKATRIEWTGGKRSTTDGPFTETKELVAGYWIIQVKSREEAVEWISRAPFWHDAQVEIRQIFEAEDLASLV